MSRRTPEGPPPAPVVQRLRLRYAKRDRLRFSSHRDFARALERALRRAGVPVAFSAGFSPHPRVSYVGAAPTGVASEAEYLEIALSRRCDPEEVRRAIDAGLPAGLDVTDCVEATTGSLPDRIDGSRWRIRLPGAHPATVDRAVADFLRAAAAPVQRRTKDGLRTVDARAAVVALTASEQPEEGPCVILDVVVRHLTPAVRPDDLLSALTALADLHLVGPAEATRLAQGGLAPDGTLTDPLAADRMAARDTGAA